MPFNPRASVLLGLALLTLGGCNRSTAENAAAQPTADITATDIASGTATSIPAPGAPGNPSDAASSTPTDMTQIASPAPAPPPAAK